jgi:hypothetical protein
MQDRIGSQFAHDLANILRIKPPTADNSDRKMTGGANLARVGRKLFLDLRRLPTCHRTRKHKKTDTPKPGIQSEVPEEAPAARNEGSGGLFVDPSVADGDAFWSTTDRCDRGFEVEVAGRHLGATRDLEDSPDRCLQIISHIGLQPAAYSTSSSATSSVNSPHRSSTRPRRPGRASSKESDPTVPSRFRSSSIQLPSLSRHSISPSV